MIWRKLNYSALDLEGAWHQQKAYPTVKENATQGSLVPLHPQVADIITELTKYLDERLNKDMIPLPGVLCKTAQCEDFPKINHLNLSVVVLNRHSLYIILEKSNVIRFYAYW